MINGANSRMVSHITGRTVCEETSSRTRTYDVIKSIRVRRLKWVGDILRMDQGRMVHKALAYIYEHPKAGDLLMDTPRHLPWLRLVELATNKKPQKHWDKLVKALEKAQEPRVSITINGELDKFRRQTARTGASNNTAATELSPSKRRARRYIQRDRHEAFFRPLTKEAHKHRCKKFKSKPKKTTLTDKQRAAAARAHYHKHHGTQPQQPLQPSDIFQTPQIHGHHRHHHHCEHNHNKTISITPPPFEEMWEYQLNATKNKNILSNFSDIIDS